MRQYLNYMFYHDNTIIDWLKDNQGNYFLAVDTHIQRLANRTGYAKGKTVEQTEQAIIKNTPKKNRVYVQLTPLVYLTWSLYLYRTQA